MDGHVSPPVGANDVLLLQAAILNAPNVPQAAAVFATGLCRMFALERGCVGLLQRGAATVVGVSHGADSDASDVAAAMEEAIDQGATVSFPQRSGKVLIIVAHEACATMI